MVAKGDAKAIDMILARVDDKDPFYEVSDQGSPFLGTGPCQGSYVVHGGLIEGWA